MEIDKRKSKERKEGSNGVERRKEKREAESKRKRKWK
jgi:hypothetical protein